MLVLCIHTFAFANIMWPWIGRITGLARPSVRPSVCLSRTGS